MVIAMNQSIPNGIVVVTKEQFFSALYADTRDIMPSHVNPLYTTWETKQREVWGWSFPGWKNTGLAKVYAIYRTR